MPELEEALESLTVVVSELTRDVDAFVQQMVADREFFEQVRRNFCAAQERLDAMLARGREDRESPPM